MSDLLSLYTPAGTSLPACPWDTYPRPSLRRTSFFCLNGSWDFGVVAENEAPCFDRTITVPFPPESLLSGIHTVFAEENVLCYRRRFSLPAGLGGERVILHFGAVDQMAEVFLNGMRLGDHIGGYQPFSFDITDALAATNELVVLVRDRLSDHVLPYGKQRRDRGGMWYTPFSGLWQTVWCEGVPANHITALHLPTDPTHPLLTCEWSRFPESGTVTVATPEGKRCFPLQDGQALLDLPSPRLWSPEDPFCYDCVIETSSERIESYFALRTLSIETVNGQKRMCLNDKPFFFHGLLDQGYYSDGLVTPASPDSYRCDILTMKALGFNTLRKHIKIEPEIFYHECDRLGMVVFQDMVNNGDYRFLRDTALPTVGLLRRDDRRLHRDPAVRAAFRTHIRETVAQLTNHPAICLWTIFNEGWGQFCGTEAYRALKKLDPTRFIDTASGWFMGCETDLDSRHIYFRRVKLKPSDKPLYLSEFGGHTYRVEEHVANPEKSYGYGTAKTRKDFVTGLRRLYLSEILPQIPKGLCAAVYTQVSDVEDEINGLLTYDRQIEKVRPEEFADVSVKLTAAITAER